MSTCDVHLRNARISNTSPAWRNANQATHANQTHHNYHTTTSTTTTTTSTVAPRTTTTTRTTAWH
eukprot:9852590-Karenia_brevis.AAC.1